MLARAPGTVAAGAVEAVPPQAPLAITRRPLPLARPGAVPVPPVGISCPLKVGANRALHLELHNRCT